MDTNLKYCDVCGRSEVDDAIVTGSNAPLIKMTSDGDLTICEACATPAPSGERSE